MREQLAMEVVSFRVFVVSVLSFGAEFRDSFGSGHGQFRTHAMVSFRPRPSRIGQKLPTSPPETDTPAFRT